MGAHTLEFRVLSIDIRQDGLTLVSNPGRILCKQLHSSFVTNLTTHGSPESSKNYFVAWAFGHQKHRCRSLTSLRNMVRPLTTEWGNWTSTLPGILTSCNTPRPLRAHGVGNGYAGLEMLVQPETDNRALHTGHRGNHPAIEELIEKVIFDCRFFTLLAVMGSLAGSLLCFFQGCVFVMESFFHTAFHGFDSGQLILLLVEALDVYLVGTVMLIFGMGLYELFVNNIDISKDLASSRFPRKSIFGSNLFGLFRLRERPLWLEIRSLDELKTKLGHVIVMILLVGMFEKSKKVPINSGIDLLFFSASILMSSGCLFLLSMLHTSK